MSQVRFCIKTKKRIVSLTGDLHTPVTASDVEDRILLLDKTDCDMDSFADKLKEVAKDRIKNINHYYVETPFIHPKTGKPLMMIVPLFVCIDSWSAIVTGKQIGRAHV